MIIEYNRPLTIDQALDLLSRPQPKSLPLGGGSVLSRKKDADFAVVDLQALGLDAIQTQEGQLIIGATARLQAIIDHADTPAWLKKVCLRETGRNLREMSTIAGALMCSDGRSPLATALLAADVYVTAEPAAKSVSYQQLLPMREGIQQPWLITRLGVGLSLDVACDFIARSPQDLPVLGMAVAKWPSGLLRVTVGGFGAAPLLVYAGHDAREAEAAVVAALKDSDDQWASAEYRQSIAPALLKRLL